MEAANKPGKLAGFKGGKQGGGKGATEGGRGALQNEVTPVTWRILKCGDSTEGWRRESQRICSKDILLLGDFRFPTISTTDG